MRTRSLVKATLSRAENLEFVRRLLDEEPGLHRTDLADRVCTELRFVDPRGRNQRSACLKALRELSDAGHFELPSARAHTGPNGPRRLTGPVAAPSQVPPAVGDLRGLRLVLVETPGLLQIWNELMCAEHPRGAGPLVGRQLRYLIDSEHGYLGGLGFAAAALQLRDRDQWIGWDVSTRRLELDRVIGLSRFLIRPQVHCRNLASRTLSMTIRRVASDFEARYGFRPWLVETFVDISCFSGTCYQAANWIRVGQTEGRGRQDRDREKNETIKDIYVYPLVEDFRERMGLAPGNGMGALDVAEGLEGGSWAENEFSNAPLGDQRLSKRLVRSAAAQASQPSSAFTTAAKGERALIKGHYRLIDQPDESAVTLETILLPHRGRTLRRMQTHQRVLCIQDGTKLDYTNLNECEGLGITGTNQTKAKSRGLHLHTTYAVTSDGLPLGILQAQCFAPGKRSKKDKRPTKAVPIEEKETFCWMEGIRDCMEIADDLPATRLVSVMDREADIFELFDEQRNNPCIDLLVRAKYNRCTTEQLKLFDAVKSTPVRQYLQIHVDRRSARPKRSKQKAQPKRSERVAEVAQRYTQVELRPPPYHKDKDPIRVSIVHVVEESPPEGVKKLEWFLLTTIEVSSPAEAEDCLHWYSLRWRIEDWHRVLKTGCRIEELQHESAERLKRAIAINMVIAWRIMLMTLLGRETPELPMEVLFSDIEIQVLQAFAPTVRKPLPQCLKDAVTLTAMLGGYVMRRDPPGNQVLWRGYTQLRFMCIGFEIARSRDGPAGDVGYGQR